MSSTNSETGSLKGLHILMVPSWWPTPEQPIAGIFHEDYARAFVAAGAKVGVIYPDLVSARYLGRGTRIPWIPRVSHESLAGREPTSDGAAVIRIRGLHTALGQPGIQMRRYLAWLRRGLALYRLAQGEPDIVHAMCAIPAGWACTRLGEPLGGRIVLTENTGPFSLAMSPPAAGEYVREALRGAAAIVATSAHLREEMLEVCPGRKISVIANIAGSQFVPAPPPPLLRMGDGSPRGVRDRSCHRAVFVGRLTVEKGCRELMAAALALEEGGCAPAETPGPLVEWHIVGDGPLAGEMERRMVRGLPDGRVTMHGLCDKAKVARLVSDAHFLVLPSHGENCPLAVCEALSIGRPVVGTRGTGCEALIGPEDGVLFDPGDAAGLAAAIRKVVADEAAWHWREIGRRAAERFSAESIARRYSEIFRGLVASRPRLGA